jgi:hypothetical protein
LSLACDRVPGIVIGEAPKPVAPNTVYPTKITTATRIRVSGGIAIEKTRSPFVAVRYGRATARRQSRGMLSGI